MFCTRCATFNPPDTARCGGCGARLDWTAQERAHRRSSDRRNWFLLLPFALAIGVMAVVGWRTWEVRQTQSAAYDRALTALDAGNLPAAIDEFGEAGGYRDAQERRITTQELLAPYQAAYLDARAALDEGENHRAVELLRSVMAAMPDNVDAESLLSTAEARYRTDLERSITVATTNRDWLEVERATLTLAAFTGEAPDEADLAALRLTHAPILFTRDGALYRISPDSGDEALLLVRPERIALGGDGANSVPVRLAARSLEGASVHLQCAAAGQTLTVTVPNGPAVRELPDELTLSFGIDDALVYPLGPVAHG